MMATISLNIHLDAPEKLKFLEELVSLLQSQEQEQRCTRASPQVRRGHRRIRPATYNQPSSLTTIADGSAFRDAAKSEKQKDVCVDMERGGNLTQSTKKSREVVASGEISPASLFHPAATCFRNPHHPPPASSIRPPVPSARLRCRGHVCNTVHDNTQLHKDALLFLNEAERSLMAKYCSKDERQPITMTCPGLHSNNNSTKNHLRALSHSSQYWLSESSSSERQKKWLKEKDKELRAKRNAERLRKKEEEKELNSKVAAAQKRSEQAIKAYQLWTESKKSRSRRQTIRRKKECNTSKSPVSNVSLPTPPMYPVKHSRDND